MPSTASQTLDEPTPLSPLIPFGTANPESYLASREAARAAAVSQGFEETTFVEQPVRWGDCDANNHVNNCVYFKWLEAGRMMFMSTVPGAFPGKRAGVGKGMILGAAGINYLRPTFFPDTVLIAHKLRVLGERKVVLESFIWSYEQRAQVGKGDAVLVAFDYDAGKSYPIPPETRKYLEARVHGPAKL